MISINYMDMNYLRLHLSLNAQIFFLKKQLILIIKAEERLVLYNAGRKEFVWKAKVPLVTPYFFYDQG